MDTSIDGIVKLVPPPANPVGVGGKKEWAKVEKRLGAKLPSDYKAFIERYGSGEFAGFYVVYNPFSATVNLLEKFESHGKNYSESHDSDPENFPLAMFPEVPGMIPWGHDTNGHTYFWLVQDKKKPDGWTVVWDEGDDQGFEGHDFTFGEYLLGVLRGEIDPLDGNYPNEVLFVFRRGTGSRSFPGGAAYSLGRPTTTGMTCTGTPPACRTRGPSCFMPMTATASVLNGIACR